MADTVYYLRRIHGRIETIREAMPDEHGLSLGNLALADEADWLDGYIDQLERQSTTPSDKEGGE